MTATEWVEVIASLTMAIGVLAILLSRVKRGIGIRVVQFAAVILMLPTILILALEDVLSTEVTGTLLGAIAGYILSSVGGGRDTGDEK